MTSQNPPEKRFTQHKNLKQRKQQTNKVLYRAFEKYGIENFKFEIIETINDLEIARSQERKHISEYNSNNPEFGYNVTEGGEGVWGYRHSKEICEKMSKAKRKYFEDPAARKKWSEHRKGKSLTKSHKKKIKQGVQKWMGSLEQHPNTGRVLTEEHKKKVGDAHRGKPRPEHVIEKLRTSNSLWWEVTFPDGRKERVFNLRQFCTKHNLTPINLSRTASGILKQHKGFTCRKLNSIDQ